MRPEENIIGVPADGASDIDLLAILSGEPTIVGRSKKVFALGPDRCIVQMLPSLTSFTHARDEIVSETESLRLDFYELAASALADAGIATVYQARLSSDTYLATYCEGMPVETIVKNVAVGSTQRKYPGLFPDGHRFSPPVVKFDYRVDPEDQPISDDYVAAMGFDISTVKRIALDTNRVLQRWLLPNELLDFCVILGRTGTDHYTIISEISPDCMRLRSPSGSPLDKDLFRFGASHADIRAAWRRLIAGLGR